MTRSKVFLSWALSTYCAWTVLAPAAGSPVEEFKWIPKDAQFVMVLNRPPHSQELYARFGAAITFATGTDEAIRHFTESTGVDPFQGAERLVIARLARGDGRNETLAIIRRAMEKAVPVSTADSGFVIDSLDVGHLVFGDVSAVKRAKALSKVSGDNSVLQNARIMRLFRDHGSGVQVGGAATPDWLGSQCKDSDLAAADVDGTCVCRALRDIQSVAFSATVEREAFQFRMRTEVASDASAGILADALRGYLASLLVTAKSTAPAEVQQLLNQARVRTDKTAIELAMLLDSPALQRVRANESSRALLQWQLEDARREGFQNIREILAMLELAKGSRVADIGCGLGFFTVRLARAVGAQGKVYAVDVDTTRLEKLRWRVEQGRFPQVEVILGDQDDPKLPDGTLDAILIVNSYHEMPRHQEMLRHIRAALKPGGFLLLTEPMSKSQRADPRENQEKNHVLAPELAEQDLRLEGFEILARNDDFILYPDSGRQDWLILARRAKSADGQAVGEGGDNKRGKT